MPSAAACRISTAFRRSSSCPTWRRVSSRRRSAGSAPCRAAAQVFRIDHDENFNETTHLQYQPLKNGPWLGFNWRYDSGLVAGPVPCAGGNCANGPNGTDSIVDVSGITPDQQFQAGLYCGSVHATPTTPISPTGLCPASQYGSNLVKIPAAGTENDDHNPPRIAPRNLFDLAMGDDNLFPRRQVQVEPAADGGQPDQQRGALQFPFHLQRDALRHAARADGDHRLPLLSMAESPERDHPGGVHLDPAGVGAHRFHRPRHHCDLAALWEPLPHFDVVGFAAVLIGGYPIFHGSLRRSLIPAHDHGTLHDHRAGVGARHSGSVHGPVNRVLRSDRRGAGGVDRGSRPPGHSGLAESSAAAGGGAAARRRTVRQPGPSCGPAMWCWSGRAGACRWMAWWWAATRFSTRQPSPASPCRSRRLRAHAFMPAR